LFFCPDTRIRFLFRTIARGKEKASSEVDLMVVGSVSFNDVVAAAHRLESAGCHLLGGCVGKTS